MDRKVRPKLTRSERFRGRDVLILGWAGSTMRQLRAIERWYRNRGARVTIWVPDVLGGLVVPNGWNRQGSQVCARLGRASSIYVHLFSNAGFWTFAGFLQEASAETISSIDAVILDSAPGIPEHLDPDFSKKYSAMAMMPLLKLALGQRPTMTDPLWTPVLEAVMLFWYRVSPQQVSNAERSLDVVARMGNWPSLLLYSLGDSLVEAIYVEDFMARLARYQRPYDAHRFETSQHVRHLVDAPRAYLKAIDRFLP